VYLLMIRPQQRRQQQAQQQQNTIQPGARVRTTAGMYATVVDVNGDDVILGGSPGGEGRYLGRAVMDVVAPADEDTDSADETDEIDDIDETDDSDLDEEASDDTEDTA